MDKGGLPAVPLGSIRVEPQVRSQLDLKKIELMQASIAEEGLHCPIKLRRFADGSLVVIDGHYRLAALAASGHTTVLASIDETAESEAAVISAQLATQVRFPLDPMDEARAIDRYLRISGTTAASLARRTAKSEAYICRARALVGIKDEIGQLVEAGHIGPSLALELNRIRDPNLYAELLNRGRQGELRREDLQRAPRAARRVKEAKTRKKSVRPVVISVAPGCNLTVIESQCSIDQLFVLLTGLLGQVQQVKESAGDLARLVSAVRQSPLP